MPARVLFVGCCSLDADVVIEGGRNGEFPNFSELLAQGLSGRIAGLPGFYVGATWPSFFTGFNPSNHGCNYVEQMAPGSYTSERCPRAKRITHKPFWEHLGAAGRKVAILDVPHARPATNLNGVQLVEWGCHDHDYGRVLGYPAGFAEEITARFGNHPIDRLCDGEHTAAEFLQLRDGLIAGIGVKAVITKHILDSTSWDFVAQVFSEAHCAGHQCCHLHDSNHPAHDAAFVDAHGDPMLAVYAAVDAAIGASIKHVGDDTTVIVLTSMGMGPKYTITSIFEEILLRLGYSEPSPRDGRPAGVSARTVWERVDPYVTRTWQRLPERDAVRGKIDDALIPAPRVDRSASRCFSVPTDHCHGGIRLNLVGREARGRIQPGVEADALCVEVEAALKDIVNVDTGAPVVRRIIRAREIYSGARLDDLPDMLIEWDSDVPIRAVTSAAIGTLRNVERSSRTDNHHPDGFVAVTGRQIRAGFLETPPSIVDIAPTIARLMDVKLPAGDGTPIERFFVG